MTAVISNATLFMEFQDQRTLHQRRSRLVLLTTSWVLVAMDLCLLAASFAAPK